MANGCLPVKSQEDGSQLQKNIHVKENHKTISSIQLSSIYERMSGVKIWVNPVTCSSLATIKSRPAEQVDTQFGRAHCVFTFWEDVLLIPYSRYFNGSR